MGCDSWKGRRRPYHTCACGETVWFNLSGGPFSAVIDAEDAPRIGHWNWRANVSGCTVYAVRLIAGRHVALHRIIVDAPDGLEVDHRYGQGLDNRKRHLRVATISQNRANSRLSRRNTSGFKGVSLNKAEGKFKAYVGTRHIGTFATAIEAANAYDAAAVAIYGEFAATNKSLGLL